MRHFFISLLLIVALSSAALSQHVRVAAAANLRFVLDSIKASYEKEHPKSSVDITLGSSGVLLQQITGGAQFDLFMAADNIYPAKLKEKGMASGDAHTYAFGKLVLWSNAVDVSKGAGVVTSDSVKHIAIAKPETAPYGDRAIQFLKNSKLYDRVKGKIVYADNISQAAQFAYTGNAEAGFIALSLALAPEMKKGRYILIDTADYAPIEQQCILVKTRESNPEAQRFMEYLSSARCRDLFLNAGYDVPEKMPAKNR